jgi:hypothetical protein
LQASKCSSDPLSWVYSGDPGSFTLHKLDCVTTADIREGVVRSYYVSNCNECGSEKVEWTPMSGKGEVYSFTVIRQVVGRAASQAFEPDIPYMIAWVDLDEGPRLITNVIGCAVEDVKLGMKVTVQFEKASEKVWLPKFKPA